MCRCLIPYNITAREFSSPNRLLCDTFIRVHAPRIPIFAAAFKYLILEALGTNVEDTPVGVFGNPSEGKVFLVTMLDHSPKTFFPMRGTRPKYVQ